MSLYFILNESVKLVEGAVNAVIYDFKHERMFHINKNSKDLVKRVTYGGLDLTDLDKNDNDALQYLNYLESIGIGYFSDKVSYATELIPDNSLVMNMMWLMYSSECNLNCIHCYNSHDRKNNAHLNIKVIDRVLSDSVKYFDLKSVQLIGGEPLMWGSLVLKKIIRAIIAHGIDDIEIFTNGTMLNDYLLSMIKDNNLAIAISIYSSNPATHDYITGSSGSWRLTVDAIEKLLKHNVRLRLSTVAMSVNAEEVDGINLWAKERFGYSHKGKVYDVIRPCGGGSNKKLIPKQLFSDHFILKDNSKFMMDSRAILRNIRYHSCWGSEFCLRPNGDITPCEMSLDVQGNVNNKSLYDIINRCETDNAWHLTKDKIEVCSCCEYRYSCFECRPLAMGLSNIPYTKPLNCIYDPLRGIWQPYMDQFDKILPIDNVKGGCYEKV